MFCFHCGAKVADDCRYCDKCGKFIAVEEEAPVAQRREVQPDLGIPHFADDPKLAPPPRRANKFVPKGAQKAAAKSGGGRCCLFFAIGSFLSLLVVGALSLAVYWWWQKGGFQTPSTPTLRPTSVGPASTSPAPRLSFSDIVGEWEVDPSDPLYRASAVDANRMTLAVDGTVLVGRHLKQEIFRLTQVQGRAFSGTIQEGSTSGNVTIVLESDGTLTMAARMADQEKRVKFRRWDGKSQPTPAETPSLAQDPVLYSTQGDLDGDGQMETVLVVSLRYQTDPRLSGSKEMRIIKQGRIVFRSPSFDAPFRPEMDGYADKPEHKAGVHIEKESQGSAYPTVLLVLASATEDVMRVSYDGKSYQMR